MKTTFKLNNTILRAWAVLSGELSLTGAKLIEKVRVYFKNPKDRKKNLFLCNRLQQEIIQAWHSCEYYPLKKEDKVKLARASEAGMEMKAWLYGVQNSSFETPVKPIPRQLTLSIWKRNPEMETTKFKTVTVASPVKERQLSFLW